MVPESTDLTAGTGEPSAKRSGPGRPTDYSEDLAARICEELASGKPLVRICLADDMPEPKTIYRWLAKHPEFSHMYIRAREDQADTNADEIVQIADTPEIGVKTITRVGADGKQIVETVTGDMVEHRKLRIDARKWNAAKLKPKKYGEKIQHTGDGGGPVAVAVSVADDMSDEQLATIAARRVDDKSESSGSSPAPAEPTPGTPGHS